MKKIFIFGLILIISISTISYYTYSRKVQVSNNNNSLVNVDNSPCSPPPPEKNTNEEKTEVKDDSKVIPKVTDVNNFNEKSTLQKIVSTYFNVKNPSDITISQQTNTHAQGEFEQKWWLAFNDNKHGWKVIATGCSYINCHEINGYNFPLEMVPVCWDIKSNQLITQ